MRHLSSVGNRFGPALAAALVLAFVAFSIFPAGFHGGLTDDAQYLAAGRAWFADAPWLGTTHWALRHPLVLSIAGAFALAKPGIASAMWVPTLFGILFAGAGFAALFRLVSPRAAWLWLALVLLNPIVHEMGTSLFPEIAELALGTLGLGLVWAAKGRLAPAALVAAGLFFGLAALTRETIVVIAPLVAWIVWRAHGLRGIAAVALGAFVPVAADTFYLHAMSGDWLYRLHVDSAHTKIASAHLRGGTFEGRVFFNPDLAARWIPAGPAKIHWALNPLIDFVIDPDFGFLLAGWLVAALALRRERDADRSIHRSALALAALAYVGVCWVLMLRPQPRYFLFAILAASVSCAILFDRAWDSPRRRLAVGLFALLLASGLFGVVRQHDYERLPRMVLPYLRAHPGIYHSDPVTMRRVNEWLVEEKLPSRLVDSPPAPGALVLRREKFDIPSGEQRQLLAKLDGRDAPKWRLRGLKGPRPMIVERRIR